MTFDTWISQFPPHYVWWSIAAILMMIELIIPGAFFLWIGIASILTGLIAFKITSQFDLIFIFSILSVLSVWMGKYIYGMIPFYKNIYAQTLNQRGASYVGEIFTLNEAIINGAGRLKIEDGSWKITGPDLPEGTKVMIVSLDGITFTVRKATKKELDLES
jgi:membrane protein implicated in regulation of membrane protease activity